MKKLGIILITFILLMVGIAMADTGIPQVNEVQGLTTSTTVIAAGNFNAASSATLTISRGVAIPDIPGPEWTGLEVPENGLYTSMYTEDTQNSDVGYISYDKDLDISTANKVSGQYNIQAVKQITYLGIDASSVVTNDYMLLDGVGLGGIAGDRLICPFAGGSDWAAFCNRIETGSNMNLKVANLNTQMGDRFIMKSADPGVTLYNNVGVDSYATNLPSQGSVSAYIRGSIKEGGRDDYPGSIFDLTETVTFLDSTGISGTISTFSKTMSYNSVLDIQHPFEGIVVPG
jgi:hypothetical protein